MYNANLCRLMKKHGFVKGLKTVCAACNKYAMSEKFMVYIPAFQRVYFSFYDGTDSVGNLPLNWCEYDYWSMNVEDCHNMIDLYIRLINTAVMFDEK